MKKAIVTLCTSEFLCMGQYSHQSFRRYAEKTGSDFIILNEHNRKFPHMNIIFEKYQLTEILGDYNRVMYIDTDAFIKPECPDLFELVPYDCFAGTYENAGNVPADEHLVSIIRAQLGYIPWERGLMNDGVFLVSDTLRDIFTIVPNTPNEWMWNLYLLNYNIYRLGHKVFTLDTKYNGMFVYGYRNKELPDTDALIIHYAACGDLRPGKLQHLYEKYLK